MLPPRLAHADRVGSRDEHRYRASSPASIQHLPSRDSVGGWERSGPAIKPCGMTALLRTSQWAP